MDPDAAQSGSRCASASRSCRRRPVEDGRTNDDPEATIGQLFEFDILLAPDRLERLDRRTPRLRLTLLQLMDCPLGQANARTEIGLAPPEHGACQSNFRGKAMPFDPKELTEIMRMSRGMYGHDANTEPL